MSRGERVKQDRKVSGALKAAVHNRDGSVEVKKSLHDSVLLTDLMYVREI